LPQCFRTTSGLFSQDVGHLLERGALLQDQAFLAERIWHDFVRLEVPRWFQLFCRIYADPLSADAEVEKGDQHLPLHLPGHFTDSPRAPKTLQGISGDISDGPDARLLSRCLAVGGSQDRIRRRGTNRALSCR
jgi:hypothetical protein